MPLAWVVLLISGFAFGCAGIVPDRSGQPSYSRTGPCGQQSFLRTGPRLPLFYDLKESATNSTIDTAFVAQQNGPRNAFPALADLRTCHSITSQTKRLS